MKRFSVVLLLMAFFACSLGISGCGDDKDPLYWVDKLYDRPSRELGLKRISEMFSSLKAANNNNVSAQPVKEFASKVTPGLVDAFKEFRRDRINRNEIIKLLSQMSEAGVVPSSVFLEALDVDVTKEQGIFIVAADTLARDGRTEALPKLIQTHENLLNDRRLRGGMPFSTRENELDDAVLTAIISITLENPTVAERAKVVKLLCDVVDTRDSLQDLRLNMKAVKALGQLGDAAAVPTLIRAIAMMGEVQKVGLGPFAFVALQQIMDRDAVVDSIIAFAHGKDQAFNDYFRDDIANDANLKIPVWYIQQATDFLGTLNYASAHAIEFLMTEVNHTEVDDLDNKSYENGETDKKFTAEQWATWRRNWSIVSLAQLGHKPVLDIIRERMKVKVDKNDKAALETTMEEVTGYLRALNFLQEPKESCPVILDLAKTRSEALRDKTYYYAGLMCGPEFLPIMKEEHDKINCDQIVRDRIPEDADDSEKNKAKADCETLKGRIATYMDGIKAAQACGNDFECFVKIASERTNPNIEVGIYGAYRLARGDEAKSKRLVEVLSKELENPVMAALEANIFALDRLTPNGDAALVKRCEEVRQNFVAQQTYKDRARLVEAFGGHVKARTK